LLVVVVVVVVVVVAAAAAVAVAVAVVVVAAIVMVVVPVFVSPRNRLGILLLKLIYDRQSVGQSVLMPGYHRQQQ
jgi:hypothetical protein